MFAKVTKLNLGINLLSETKSMLGSMLNCVDFDAIQLKEETLINLDKVMGISEVVPTGSKDKSEPQECVKLYFGKNDYWAIAVDDNYKALKKFIYSNE